jgi:hypothetical protein
LRRSLSHLLLVAGLISIFSLFSRSGEAAGIQKSGPQIWPGRLQVGVNLIGGQSGFNTFSISGYKLTTDISGLLKQFDPMSLWLGGGFNYTAGVSNCFVGNGFFGDTTCGHDLQFWAFVMFAFDRLSIPLVPFVRVGLAADAIFLGDITTGGAFGLRFGAGVHYWLLRFLGLGIESNFTLGPSFFDHNFDTRFYGTWDIGIGARFAF